MTYAWQLSQQRYCFNTPSRPPSLRDDQAGKAHTKRALDICKEKIVMGYRPLSLVVKAKAGSESSPLTWTAWAQFQPSPTHNMCLICSAMSCLTKLACLVFELLEALKCILVNMDIKIPRLWLIMWQAVTFSKLGGIRRKIRRKIRQFPVCFPFKSLPL